MGILIRLATISVFQVINFATFTKDASNAVVAAHPMPLVLILGQGGGDWIHIKMSQKLIWPKSCLKFRPGLGVPQY